MKIIAHAKRNTLIEPLGRLKSLGATGGPGLLAEDEIAIQSEGLRTC
jgi:hypothetical protein